jgi:hypothetical protein
MMTDQDLQDASDRMKREQQQREDDRRAFEEEC